ncbi:MAG: menaquinone biosynthesis protein [Bacteroidales bacterium]|nr:menaquinone biosynthesis protein [Bacteroidales bacterium]
MKLKPRIRISAISYLNSLPFAWCLEHSPVMDEIELSYDIPSQCADKLLTDKTDIGLIPIVETLRMPEHYIVSDLCIGAGDAVRTVLVASETPLDHISTIYLDHHSRTSVALARVLAMHYWKITPEWVDFAGDITSYPRSERSAAVVIGDKAFGVQSPYIYDLAVEWRKFSGLPFVFACWVSNKPLDGGFVGRFNEAMKLLDSNMDAIAVYYRDRAPAGVDLLDYWTNNINYPLTDDKRNGLELFLQYAKMSGTDLARN